MRALLLSAGLGTRLRPLTYDMPKCLVFINGRPLLEYWLRLLTQGGVTNILVNIHHFPDLVKRYIAHSEFVPSVTTVVEDKLLGTGGTLLKNRAFFEGGPVILIHADNLSLFDLQAFIRRYEERPKGIEMTMMTFRTTVPETCGIVALDDRGVVQTFHEKVKNPSDNLANGAVYILSPPVIDLMADLGKEVIDFSTEVLPRYVGRMNTFHNDVYHRDIGNIDSLMAAQREYPEITLEKP